MTVVVGGMTSIVKEFSWPMAHRLTQGYPGRCKNLHGHTYKCAVELAASMLDQYGMVIDFGWIKKMLADWVDTNLDHTVLVAAKDTPLQRHLEALASKMYIMSERYTNTTAEQIADMLYHQFDHMVKTHDEVDGEPRVLANLRLVSVSVWETETAKAVRRADHETQ